MSLKIGLRVLVVYNFGGLLLSLGCLVGVVIYYFVDRMTFQGHLVALVFGLASFLFGIAAFSMLSLGTMIGQNLSSSFFKLLLITCLNFGMLMSWFVLIAGISVLGISITEVETDIAVKNSILVIGGFIIAALPPCGISLWWCKKEFGHKGKSSEKNDSKNEGDPYVPFDESIV